MANHEINEEQEAVNKALRMIETSDPVHADVYNALFSVLINNDVFLEKLANKMVQQVMISHVMDSTNPDMVMGADQGPVITQLIEKVQKKVDVLNTNTKMTIYSKQIWASELVDNAWMKVVKIGHICVACGCFVVKNGGSVTNVDLFNISATGIKLNDHTAFSLSSFNPNGIGGIGYLEVDGRVVFALPAAGTYEWRFNFSFAEGS